MGVGKELPQLPGVDLPLLVNRGVASSHGGFSSLGFPDPIPIRESGEPPFSFQLNSGNPHASEHVTGYSYTAANPEHGSLLHAFLYSDGVMTDLGKLGPSGRTSVRDAINGSGEVTGFYTDHG
jgi:probable HAF family extracellular repeat protein